MLSSPRRPPTRLDFVGVGKIEADAQAGKLYARRTTRPGRMFPLSKTPRTLVDTRWTREYYAVACPL